MFLPDLFDQADLILKEKNMPCSKNDNRLLSSHLFLSQTLLSCWILNSLFLQDGESSSKRRRRVSQNATNAHRWGYSLHQEKNRSDHTFSRYTPPKENSHLPQKNDIKFLEKVSKNLLFQMMGIIWMRKNLFIKFQGGVVGCPDDGFFYQEELQELLDQVPFLDQRRHLRSRTVFPMFPVHNTAGFKKKRRVVVVVVVVVVLAT